MGRGLAKLAALGGVVFGCSAPSHPERGTLALGDLTLGVSKVDTIQARLGPPIARSMDGSVVSYNVYLGAHQLLRTTPTDAQWLLNEDARPQHHVVFVFDRSKRLASCALYWHGRRAYAPRVVAICS